MAYERVKPISYISQVVTKKKIITVIPIQCQMLEEAFDEEFRTFYQSADPAPLFKFEKDLFGSHRRFRYRKYKN